MLSIQSREAGQGLTEYAVILVLVVLVVIVMLGVFGSTVGNLFSQVTNKIP